VCVCVCVYVLKGSCVNLMRYIPYILTLNIISELINYQTRMKWF